MERVGVSRHYFTIWLEISPTAVHSSGIRLAVCYARKQWVSHYIDDFITLCYARKQWVSHYIDDFITLGDPDTAECAEHVRLMHIACEEVCLPVEVEKDEGPGSLITFVGIELDFDALEIRLP